MKVILTIEDKGARSVTFGMEAVIPDTDTVTNEVTPASVMALAIKAMFHNGMLAEAGAHALEEAAKGISPEQSIKQKYDKPVA